MRTPVKLAAFGLGLALVFGGAYAAATAVVPEATRSAWRQASDPAPSGGSHGSSSAHAVRGLSVAEGGYLLGPVSAPNRVGVPGELSFRVLDDAGRPVIDFAVAHEKRLHLIVVRSDGAGFRHVHPVLDRSTGIWSLPWRWTEAGSYRVFTDFLPPGQRASNVTLTRSIDVAGQLSPAPAQVVRRVDRVDGFDVRLRGDLRAGESSTLAIEVTRAGRPVTTLQPYLGAFGHLVALRSGDLAYLHVHADGAEPAADATAGPTITFATQAPTPGRYLLYLDFRVGGTVRTAEFVLDAESGTRTGGGSGHDEAPDAQPDGDGHG